MPHQPTAADLPLEFRARMEKLLGPEFDAFLAALAAPSAGLRVNTLRLSPERFLEITPFQIDPLPFPHAGFVLADAARPGTHPYHAAGLYYLQDPGAMVVGAIPELVAEPRVLDLAAAPGGKATHLAARMGGRGVLVANDVHPGRARELAGNLERVGARNAIVTCETASRLADRWGGWFDVVLVDAPCSGESMFHKSEAARREWSPTAVRGCARRQGELLDHAARLLRPGGTLVYSTCTFAPEENEAVLGEFLRASPGIEMVRLPDVPGASAARPDWCGPEADPAIEKALRLWPHRFPGAGHFIGALRSVGGGDPPAADDTPVALAPDARRLLEEFAHGQLPGVSLESRQVVAVGEELYLRSQGSPSLAGLSVVRGGWWLGSARKGRFEPSHSLAMAIDPAAAAASRDLRVESPEVAAYLRGESLRDDGGKGWVVVSVDGFAIGWGKRSGGVIKNHYPRGLRRG